MLRYLLFSAGSVLLLGCHASNPYQAESRPLPPAPITAAIHFDASAYPIATEKKTYTYWCWHDQPLNPMSASDVPAIERQVLAAQLEQYAFRPASATKPCELKVKLNSQHSQRTRRDYHDDPTARYNYGYGYPYHDRYRHLGMGIDVPITPRTYTEHYQQLILTFTDAQTGQIIWRGQSEVTSRRQAQTDETALRKVINTMLKDYH
ncbi:MAG: DUF4136 domain-containing protein [Pseudomonas sp.]|jgi:hypothetical protein|nr:DUF4136 domain-containing protein [Pseudomonas sp.]